MSEVFLFDDFFVPNDDPGVEQNVTVDGREVPIFLKRGLSLGDREAAKSIATKTHISESGTFVVDSFDDGLFQVELLFRCIKSWPFTYAHGGPVPITRGNIVSMKAHAADAMTLLVQKLVGNEEAKKEALAPFESPSDEASSSEAPAVPTSPSSPSASE